MAGRGGKGVGHPPTWGGQGDAGSTGLTGGFKPSVLHIESETEHLRVAHHQL